MFDGNQLNNNLNLYWNNQYLFQLSNHPTFQNVRKKPVGIFWDIENCQIPRGMSAYNLVEQIRALYRNLNMIEYEFAAACDVYGINKNTINELNEMQVNILHCSSFAKNACDEKLKQLIYRFIMIHGQNCAVILISSDINFAPLLSDIKNRIGILVILFHRPQVSPALLACSHHHIDYDIFCSSIAVSNSINQDNFITTYLTISNWDQNMNEDRVRNLLNRFTSNAGAREINVDYQNRSAVYMFKCKSDAQRCLQKVNDRRWGGNTLKAQIIPNLQRISKPNPISLNKNNAQKPNIQILSGRNHLLPLKFPEASEGQPGHKLSSVLKEINANRCESCPSSRNGISKHSVYLFKKEILSVHVSLDNLTEKIAHLLELHSDNRLPLNSLPQCWLNTFNEELNTTTEPKVMLEHLLNCADGIKIEYLDVDIDGEKIPIKFIIKVREDSPNQEFEKLSDKLAQLSTQIIELMVTDLPNRLTSFPSILLSTLGSKYKAQFNEPISLEQYGTASLFELISSLKDYFNLYTYGDDHLIALNFKQQLKFFAQDMTLALASYSKSNVINPQTEITIDLLMQAFKAHFDSDLNIAFYGVCFIQDLINVIERNNLKQVCPEPPVIDIEAKSGSISLIKALLVSFPSCCIKMRQFYNNYSSFIAHHLNLSFCNYSQFIRSFLQLQSKHIRIISDGETDWITLSPKLRHRVLSKRLVRIFHVMAFVGDQHHSTNCDYMISFTLCDIFAYYLLSSSDETHFPPSFFGNSSLVKIFERALINVYKYQVDHQVFLIYTKESAFLQRCNPAWIEEKVMTIFAILFESPLYTLTWEQVNHSAQKIFGYSLGPSSLYHNRVKEVIHYEVDKQVFIKMSPLYEFAAKCLSVMLLHSNSATSPTEWNLDELEHEYYKHFIVGFPKPQTYSCANYQQMFERLNLLFDVNEQNSGLKIYLKEPIFLKHVNSLSIETCNYCQTKLNNSTDKGTIL